MASGRFCPLWASLKGHVTREKHAFSRRHTCPGNSPETPSSRVSADSSTTWSTALVFVARYSLRVSWIARYFPVESSKPTFSWIITVICTLIHTYIHIRSRVARAWIAVSIQRIDPVVYHSRQPSCIDGVCVMVKWRRSRFSLSLSLSLSLSPSPSLSLTIGPIWYARNVRGARCCVYKGTNSPLQIFELEGEGCRWKRAALECISRGRFNACLRALEALAAP